MTYVVKMKYLKKKFWVVYPNPLNYIFLLISIIYKNITSLCGWAHRNQVTWDIVQTPNKAKTAPIKTAPHLGMLSKYNNPINNNLTDHTRPVNVI